MVSIIVTSYNQAKTLQFLLASLARQTEREFEVILADDGSSDETFALCQANHSFPIQWVTQEDLGYRKAKILNQAIRLAQFDYLIFLDADVILEYHFVEDHLLLRQPNHFVCGRRVDLGPQLSSQVKLKDVQEGKFDCLGWRILGSALRKDTHDIKRGLRIKNSGIRKILGYHRPLDILGSNFSIWKSDLIEVNGFNEDLESYWGEDGDLFIRLRNSGKISIGAKSLCIQYHVFHKRRIPTPQNIEYYQRMLKNYDYKKAQRGYS